MAEKPTPPAAGAAQGLVITSYSTALPQACLPKEEAAGAAKKDPKEKKAKAAGTCKESFSYYVQYPKGSSKVAKGSFDIGADGKVKAVTVSPEGQKFLADAKKEEMAKRFGDVVGYVAAWKKPIGTAPTTPEKSDKAGKKPKTAEILSGVLLGTDLSDKVINFVVLGAASPTAGREIAVDLMQSDKRDLVLKVLGNLKDQAGKATDPDHQAQKARVELLIIQVTLASKVGEALNKDTKAVSGEIPALVRSIVATTVSGLSYDGKESPLDFLKSKFDDFAKANAKGVTVLIAGTPPKEETIDPYQFLFDRLSRLKTEPAYANTQTGPGKILADSLEFLKKAASKDNPKERRIDYITLSPEEAFKASLTAQISSAGHLINSVAAELADPNYHFVRADWESWLNASPYVRGAREENYKRVVKAVSEGIKFDAKEGKIIVNLGQATSSVASLVIQLNPGDSNPLTATMNQRGTHLAAISIARILLGSESKPNSSIRAWDPTAKEFRDIAFAGNGHTFASSYPATIGTWRGVLGVPLVLSAPPAPTEKPGETKVPPAGKTPATGQTALVGPLAPTPAPAVEPPPSGVPLVPTASTSTPSAKRTSAIHWSAFALEAAAVLTGSVLLAAANDSSASPDQGVLGVGNPAFTHSGGAVLGFGLGGLAGRGTSLLIERLKPHKPWTPVRSLLPDIAGAVVGGVLGGLIPLATRSAVENATGGGNTGRNPGMDYGALITVPLP